MPVYLYTLPAPFSYSHCHFDGVNFSNDWITISDGTLTINTAYSWDGCTPKWQPFGLFTIGTPDGALRYGKSWLHDQSLVHDVLCQFRHQLPFSQEQVTQIFSEHMQAVQWPLHRTYTFAVNHLGPQDFPNP